MLTHEQKCRDYKIVEVYNQGWDACFENKTIYDNPYKDTEFACYWMNGFRDAWELEL